MTFVDKMAVVEAGTVYVGGTLVGNDYKVTLPDVVPVTADVGGIMGTMSIPLLNTLESMEATVSKVGVDANAALMCSPGKKTIQVNWVQDKVKSSGDVTAVGCKAQLGCIPKSYMPAADLEVGSASEFDCAFEVYEYKLTVDGAVIFHVNRLTNTLKTWDGKKLVDKSASFNKLL